VGDEHPLWMACVCAAICPEVGDKLVEGRRLREQLAALLNQQFDIVRGKLERSRNLQQPLALRRIAFGVQPHMHPI
jgi:hypothetical protein